MFKWSNRKTKFQIIAVTNEEQLIGYLHNQKQKENIKSFERGRKKK